MRIPPSISTRAGTMPYLRLFKCRGHKRKIRRSLVMWRKLLITTAAVAGVLGIVTVNADAREMGFGGQGSAVVNANTSVKVHNARVNARTRADLDARAQVRTRGPDSRPPGWSQGRKNGLHCRVRTHGC